MLSVTQTGRWIKGYHVNKHLTQDSISIHVVAKYFKQ